MTVSLQEQKGRRLYVCENCGRLGPIATFDDECRPGWTHGRLRKVEGGICARGVVGCDIEHEPDDEGPCYGTAGTFALTQPRTDLSEGD